MLLADDPLAKPAIEAVRFATPDSLEEYSWAANDSEPIERRAQQLFASRTLVDKQTALEESFFLGLRMNRGVSLTTVVERFGAEAVREFDSDIAELTDAGLLENKANTLRLTSQGRLLSNEVFARFL